MTPTVGGHRPPATTLTELVDGRRLYGFADDDGAGRRADAHAKALDPPPAQHFACVVVHLADDPQRCAHCALGVVLARGGRAEEREHAVTGEILHIDGGQAAGR